MIYTVNDNLIMKKNVAKKAESLITVPDTLGEKTDGYEVIETGPGFLTFTGERVPMTIQKGDIVYLPKGLVTETIISGETYYTTSEREIKIAFRK